MEIALSDDLCHVGIIAKIPYRLITYNIFYGYLKSFLGSPLLRPNNFYKVYLIYSGLH